VTVLLVTGTDTGIGKTVVSSAIAAALAARGRRVAVAKPAETGCAPDPEDALALRAAAGDPSPIETVCPWILPEPLAPALAAERAGVRIDVDGLVAHLRTRAARADVLLIEGAGGLLVPLHGTTTFADLAARIPARVVVVVGSRLGAINHALLTLETLERRGIAIAGYVVNELGPPNDLAVATNDALLRGLTSARHLGTVPWTPDAPALLAALRGAGSDVGDARGRLAALGAALDLDALAH
jgi:dethiobiotin synthetase